VHVSLNLTRPDGTPLTEDELPAKGTLIVLQVDGVNSDASSADVIKLIEADFKPFAPAITARVLGWVPAPRVDASARRLLRAACRALNIRDEGEGASDQHRSAVRAQG
jgi:hypothetical protein